MAAKKRRRKAKAERKEAVRLGKRKSIALVVAAILGAGIYFFFSPDRRRSAMPVFEGKTAEQWFFGPNSEKQARLAFYGMGTNCVPFLLEKAAMSDSAFKKSYYWLSTKLPTRLRPRAPLAPGYVQSVAWSHLAIWSQESDFMTTEILAAIKRVECDWTRYHALEAMTPLAGRRPRTDRKAHYLTFLDDRSFMVRLEAAVQLAHFNPRMTNALPILMNAATNTAFLERETFRSYSPNVQIPTNVMQSIIRGRQSRAKIALKELQSPEVTSISDPEVELTPTKSD